MTDIEDYILNGDCADCDWDPTDCLCKHRCYYESLNDDREQEE